MTMAHAYKEMTTKFMNKVRLYEHGVNRKPRMYELVSSVLSTLTSSSESSSNSSRRMPSMARSGETSTQVQGQPQ